MSRSIRSVFLSFSLVCAATVAHAETELSFYTGFQSSPHSVVTGTDPEASWSDEFTAGWKGKSFAMPPYYGFRVTKWGANDWGWGGEFTHAKAYLDDESRAENGYDRFEFTDGHNVITVNLMRRWPAIWGDKMTPYAGGGLGIALPHVDIQATEGEHTFGYQLTGVAVRGVAGVSYFLNDRWSAFGEYQMSYSLNEVELENGGSLETNLITNALNIGLSYSY